MFRIVSVNDTKALKKISHWNARVEKALGGVTQDYYGDDGSSAASTWQRKVESGGDDVVRRGGAYRRLIDIFIQGRSHFTAERDAPHCREGPFPTGNADATIAPAAW